VEFGVEVRHFESVDPMALLDVNFRASNNIEQSVLILRA
jgi:hypothetical protein